MPLELIQYFDTLFRKMEFKNPKMSAAYYIILTDLFPASFKQIDERIKALWGKSVKESRLQDGRNELLKKGIIIKYNIKDETCSENDFENLLPSNPMKVWNDNKDKIRGLYSEETMAFHNEHIKKFGEEYLQKLKTRGIEVEIVERRCEITLDTIDAFDRIFTYAGFKNSRGAAAYYAILIEQFPPTFQQITSRSIELLGKGFRPSSLNTGKNELFKKGLIAEVYLADKDIDFDNEKFLPVNPQIIWDEISSQIRQNISEEIYNSYYNAVIELNDKYLLNIKKYGLGTETGSITMIYRSQWFLYNLINNMKYNKSLFLMLVGLQHLRSLIYNTIKQC